MKRRIPVRVRTVVAILMVVVVQVRMVMGPMLALVMRDRHDLAAPCAKRKLRQQHHACHDLGCRGHRHDETVRWDPPLGQGSPTAMLLRSVRGAARIRLPLAERSEGLFPH